MSKANDSKNKWIACSGIEKKKLAAAQEGWQLAGSTVEVTRQTRGGQKKLREQASSSTSTTPRNKDVPPVIAADHRPDVDEDDGTAVSGLTVASSQSGKKPAHSRVIVDVTPVTTMLETHLRPCPNCGARLKLSFPTVCIASRCAIICPDCNFRVESLPDAAGLSLPERLDSGRRRPKNVERTNTNYSANVAFVLSFIASGDGGTEAARVLGLMGLPNSTTMQSRSFGNIESFIGPTVVNFTERIINDNLGREVEAVYDGRCHPTSGEKLYDLWLQGNLQEEHWPRIRAGTDMGWQQKGSGRCYNSKSGHAFFIGDKTRLVVAKELCSRACATCKSWYTTHPMDGIEPPEHRCTINHEGTSGSMEAKAVLLMYERLYSRKQVILSHIVSDDDSSIKATLKWSNEDHMANHNTTTAPTIINGGGNTVKRPEKGMLNKDIPEPDFLADPNHRVKTLGKELYLLKKRPKTPPEIKEAEDKRTAANKVEKAAKKAVTAATKKLTAAPTKAASEALATATKKY